MTCIECKKELSYIDHKRSIDFVGAELCSQHRKRMEKLILKYNTSSEAIQLYYGLKEAGLQPIIEWWDGQKFVDLALSRVKLNIEIDTEYEMITHEQAMNDLEEAMHSFKNGFKIKREAFADRNYNADLSLVSRKLPNALIQKPKLVMEHIIRMIKNSKVKTVEGELIAIEADTFCVHGDTPTALQILTYLTVEFTKLKSSIKK